MVYLHVNDVSLSLVEFSFKENMLVHNDVIKFLRLTFMAATHNQRKARLLRAIMRIQLMPLVQVFHTYNCVKKRVSNERCIHSVMVKQSGARSRKNLETCKVVIKEFVDLKIDIFMRPHIKLGIRYVGVHSFKRETGRAFLSLKHIARFLGKGLAKCFLEQHVDCRSGYLPFRILGTSRHSEQFGPRWHYTLSRWLVGWLTLLAVDGCSALGKLLEPQDCVSHILPVIANFLRGLNLNTDMRAARSQWGVRIRVWIIELDSLNIGWPGSRILPCSDSSKQTVQTTPRMDIQVFKCDIARYREDKDKQDMLDRNRGENLTKAQDDLKKKQHPHDKSLEFVLENRRCSVFIPRELSFLSFGTDLT
ncbi:protein phosphatase 2A regulatory subunit A [Striga asiatica]|uniref:Protein phosphatase 2A regulatory subunit A n=1 Tax=Striga asiatica TaxID=4170 RepID=A0A5A7Q7B8_STRAF|nr:protein phosphatase 2A regulatory subunit A [Striga asiatica]